MEMIKEPEFWVAVAFVLFIGVLVYVGAHKKITDAQEKGLTSGRTLFKHTLRGALTPIATIAGLDLGGLLGGAIITEQVFNYDGLGRTAVMAATTYDLPVTVGIVLVVATFVISANIVVDVLYAVIDPRVKYT